MRDTRTLARSVRLFRAFLREQQDPDGFYELLARDSVAQLGGRAVLDGCTVLDVGGGPGYFADAFRGAGARYAAIDPDAGELHARGAPASAAAQASGEALPVRTGSVDVCYSSNVLEHVPRPFAVLEEMMRVTRAGGVLVVSFTPWLSPWGGHETAPWHYLGGTRARARYRRRTGHEPKNRFGESLFALAARDVVGWARSHTAATVVAVRPRYHPWWAAWVAHVPGLRETMSWNLLVILRKR